MNSDSIDITGINKAELLAALHNNTKAIGMGALHDVHRDMTKAEAQKILDQIVPADPLGNYPMFKSEADGEPVFRFDYVMGRPVKVRFSGNTLENARLYDRDAGEDACQRVVDSLRAR